MPISDHDNDDVQYFYDTLQQRMTDIDSALSKCDINMT